MAFTRCPRGHDLTPTGRRYVCDVCNKDMDGVSLYCRACNYDVCPRHHDPSMKLLVFGNPGVGKSSICNAIARESLFQTGYSATAVTTTLQSHRLHHPTRGKIVIFDVPGLIEGAGDKECEHNAALMMKAMEEDAWMALVVMFVVSMERGGRVDPNDVQAWKRIMKTCRCPQHALAIVVNKAKPAVCRDQGFRASFQKTFCEHSGAPETTNFEFFPDDIEALEEHANALLDSLKPGILSRQGTLLTDRQELDRLRQRAAAEDARQQQERADRARHQAQEREQLARVEAERAREVQQRQERELREARERAERLQREQEMVEAARREEARRQQEADALARQRRIRQGMHLEELHRIPLTPTYFSASRMSESRSSMSSDGGKFYKGGQFLPGGGRAPKGGCYR